MGETIERKLATLEQIDAINIHSNADELEIASIKGWNAVVKKGLYNPNDWIVWFEIDAFLPIEERYEFLRKSSFRSHPDLGEGFKIKTIKLRGEISQGLALPLSEFPELVFDFKERGMDLTDLLRVQKYEAPVSGVALGGEHIGLFPSFIPKTDQERWQNLRLNDRRWNDIYEITVKMDGSSITIYHNDGKVGVCSRNFELKEDNENLFWKTVKDYHLPTALLHLGQNIAIQGELVGPGVNKNRGRNPDHRIFIFDIYDIDNRKYFTSTERIKLITQLDVYLTNNVSGVKFLDHVPVVGMGKIDELELNPAVWVKEHEKKQFNWQKEPLMIEGLVFKSIQDSNHSFKYINPQYLLKNDD